MDPKSFRDQAAEAFARDISASFDDVARVHPTVARIRGLDGIVAVLTGMEQIPDAPSLDYWIDQYVVRSIKTLETVTAIGEYKWQDTKSSRIVERRGREYLLTMTRRYTANLAGGVKLRAIAIALKAGDVSALRSAVLATRPSSELLSWRFVIGDWVIPHESPHLDRLEIA